MCPRIRKDGHLYWIVCNSEESKYAPGGGASNVVSYAIDWPPWKSKYNNVSYSEL